MADSDVFQNYYIEGCGEASADESTDLPAETTAGVDPTSNSQEDPDSEVTSATNDERHKQLVLDKENEEVKKAKGKNFDKRATTWLRIAIAAVCVIIVALQLHQCDSLIQKYIDSILRIRHDVSSEILIAWMSATVVEVIGLMWVIARSLFPFRDKWRNKKAEKKKGKGVHLDVH